MATYVISDIHGEYEKFMKLLDKIAFSDADTLYVLGDVIDRGPHPIKVLLEMMNHSNIIPIVGNHEMMALTCLPFLNKEVSEESISELNVDMMTSIMTWQSNGSETTLKEFRTLDAEMRQTIIDYLGEFSLYEELYINGKEYVLVHAGLDNFSEDKDLDEYELHEMIWHRANYDQVYYRDKYLVTGHTPTLMLNGGYIYKENNHIAIDCGATFSGRLAAYCFETEEEFYVE